MNDLVRSVPSIRLNEEMNVIGPNGKGANLPVMFFGHLVKHVLQALCHFIFGHTGPPFHPPHEVVRHRAGGAGGLCGMVLYRLASLNQQTAPDGVPEKFSP
jgi:hypothetical protein